MRTKEGLWKLSPSGLYGFVQCKACFWAENHIGKHPFTLPLRLNDAMDSRLKHRYDKYRESGKLPPELIGKIKNIRLFPDVVQLEKWRNDRAALGFYDLKNGYLLEGKIDELFINNKDEFVPADYKSSGDPPKPDKQKYYRLQLAAYAFMFSRKGYKTANNAYLLHYFTKDRKDPSLNMELEFHSDEVATDLKSFQKTMLDIVKLLNSPYPGANPECERCAWLEKRRIVR